MKNFKLLTILGLGLVSTVVLGGVTQAATTTADTTGKVKFQAPTGPTDPEGPFTLIKPGTYDEWITIKAKEGKQTLDPSFRFSFVPNFDFGTVEVSSTDQWHNLQHGIPYQAYSFADDKDFDAADGREVKHLPPFLQVVNLGSNVKYKVNVKASNFVDAAGVEADLANTKIQIKAFERKNNVLNKNNDNGTADAILDGPEASLLDGDNYLNLSTNDTLIMTPKAGEESKTAGSASSMVFHSGYSLAEDYKDAVLAADNSVRLFVPASDSPQIGTSYVSTITWTLDDTL